MSVFSVSPSLLSGDLLNLGAQLDAVRGLDHLHLDIDDGNFVRGISFGMDVVRAVAARTDIPLDAHLEVLNPCDYVEDLCACGVKRVCAHVAVSYTHLHKFGIVPCEDLVDTMGAGDSLSLIHISHRAAAIV